MKKVLLWFLAVLLILTAIPPISLAAQHNLYRNKTYAFSIVFPEGWKIRSRQTPHTVVASENLKGESIIIQVWQLPKKVTLEDFSEKDLRSFEIESFEEIKSNYADAVMRNSGFTYISNKKASWILFTYTVKQAFSMVRIKTMFYRVLYDGRMFQILCSSPAERYKHFEDIFLNSVRSFIFENPSWY